MYLAEKKKSPLGSANAGGLLQLNSGRLVGVPHPERNSGKGGAKVVDHRLTRDIRV